jgi:hypothetical protein
VLKQSLYKIATRVLVAFAVLPLIFTMPSAHAQTAAGTITALNGSATITRSAKTFGATYSVPVDVGDQLDTSPTGRLTVTLTDNSQFEMTESSTLLISENMLNANGTRARTNLTLMDGLVRSLVRVCRRHGPQLRGAYPQRGRFRPRHDLRYLLYEQYQPSRVPELQRIY